MGDHSADDLGGLLARPRPVLVLDTVKGLVAVGVVMGWVTLDNTQVSALISLAGLIIALVLSFVTQGRVTPVADPMTVDGELLVPVSAAFPDGEVPAGGR